VSHLSIDWTTVLKDPVGLAAFALFLVFAVRAAALRRSEKSLLFRLRLLMAVVCLVGGLGLAYLRERKAAGNSTIQQSSGAGSPNVQGVQGDVNITVDQSVGGQSSPPPESPKKKTQ
jgi:hypothetical protein